MHLKIGWLISISHSLRLVLLQFYNFIALVRTSTIKEPTIKQSLFYFTFILVLLQLCGPLKDRAYFSVIDKNCFRVSYIATFYSSKTRIIDCGKSFTLL